MKSKISNAWVAALLALGLTNIVQAQPSPTTVPWWDCTISGPRHGLALISFSTNTFFMQEIIVPLPPSQSSISTGSSGRTVGSGGRNSLGGSPSAPAFQIWGSQTPTGQWGFDNKGRIIGEFFENTIQICTTNTVAFFTNEAFADSSYCLTTTNVIEGFNALVTTCYTNQIICGTNCVTNAVAVASNVVFTTDTITYCIDSTNLLGGSNLVMTTICYSNAITCSAITNAFSFMGTVQPGRSLTLACSTPFGKVTYRGVPATQLPDISGSWYATKTARGERFVEFFQMTPMGGIPNSYNVFNGAGPGYHYEGFAMLSSSRQMGFAVAINPEDPAQSLAIRAVSGPFSSRTIEARTHGWDQTQGSLTNWIGFDAVKSP